MISKEEQIEELEMFNLRNIRFGREETVGNIETLITLKYLQRLERTERGPAKINKGKQIWGCTKKQLSNHQSCPNYESLYYTCSTLRTEMRFPSPLYPRVQKIRFVFLENSEIPYEVVGDLSLKAFKKLETQIRNV